MIMNGRNTNGDHYVEIFLHTLPISCNYLALDCFRLAYPKMIEKAVRKHCFRLLVQTLKMVYLK